MTQPILVAAPHTPEWVDARKTAIGGSEAAQACDMSEYGTSLDVYARKRGLLPPTEDNDAMEWGRELEPAAVRLFCRRTGRDAAEYPMSMHRHPELAHIVCTPDARLGPSELLSIKTTTNWELSKQLAESEGTDWIPNDALLQAQHEMAVFEEVNVVQVCYMVLHLRKLRVFEVKRNSGLIDKMLSIETDLWRKIEAGTPPEPNWNNRAAAELYLKLYGLNEDKQIDLGGPATGAWDSLVEARAAKSLYEKQEKAAKEILGALLRDASIGLLPDGRRIIRSTVNRKAYEVAAFSYQTLKEMKTK